MNYNQLKTKKMKTEEKEENNYCNEKKYKDFTAKEYEQFEEMAKEQISKNAFKELKEYTEKL